MSRTYTTPATKTEAQRRWEANESGRLIAESLGVTETTIRRWAKAGDWQRPVLRPSTRVPTDEDMHAARSRAERAQLATQTMWANRKAAEADAAGVHATLARQTAANVLARLNETGGTRIPASEARALAASAKDLALAYAILIDKAQLLSGDPTIVTRNSEDVTLSGAVSVSDARKAVQERALRLVSGT